MRLSQYVAPLLLLMVIGCCAPRPAKLTKPQQTFATSWLAGTWSTTVGDQMIRETWDAPNGSHMAGAIRRFAVDSGQLQDETVMVIRDQAAKLTLTIMGDQVAAETLMGRLVGHNQAVFEGSAPATITRIAYTRVDERTLTVERTLRNEGQDQALKQRWVLVPSQP